MEIIEFVQNTISNHLSASKTLLKLISSGLRIDSSNNSFINVGRVTATQTLKSLTPPGLD